MNEIVRRRLPHRGRETLDDPKVRRDLRDPEGPPGQPPRGTCAPSHAGQHGAGHTRRQSRDNALDAPPSIRPAIAQSTSSGPLAAVVQTRLPKLARRRAWLAISCANRYLKPALGGRGRPGLGRMRRTSSMHKSLPGTSPSIVARKTASECPVRNRERTCVSRLVPDVRRPCEALASGDEHLGLHVDEHHLSACTAPAINGLKQPGPLRLRAPLRSRQVPSLQRPG